MNHGSPDPTALPASSGHTQCRIGAEFSPPEVLAKKPRARRRDAADVTAMVGLAVFVLFVLLIHPVLCWVLGIA